MKIKELHLRNIASIEIADINFEKDLLDPETGLPESLFLITGDTGAGKSILLDGISMALYKTTPRIKNTSNTQKNVFTASDGNELSINSLEQYTRLGISSKQECYSELLFEGNDGVTYCARVTLGYTNGRTNKEGIRHENLRAAKWKIRKGEGDWIENDTNVRKIILDAIDLTFEQFSHMAMLAQGQFASFLTGNKKGREEILERLTNTELFSTYGTAINNIFKQAKADKDAAQSAYDLERAHVLPQDQVDALLSQQQQLKDEELRLTPLIAESNRQLNLIAGIDEQRQNRQKAQQALEQLTAVMESEDYLTSKTLLQDWEETDEARKSLKDLRENQKLLQNAMSHQCEIQSQFGLLSSDLCDRQRNIDDMSVQISKEADWLNQRQDRAELYANAKTIDVQMGLYASTLDDIDKANKLQAEEQAKTDKLQETAMQATSALQEAKKKADAKQAEIDELNAKRNALSPDSLAKGIEADTKKLNQLELIRVHSKSLLVNQQKTEALGQEIEADKQVLTALKQKKEETEATLSNATEKAEKAHDILSTMQESQGEMLKRLRRELITSHAANCPLCGQGISHELDNVDFSGILTPYEKALRQAKVELKAAMEQNKQAQTDFNKFNGSLEEKVKNLNSLLQDNNAAKEELDQQILDAGLDPEQPISAQLGTAFQQTHEHVNELKKKQIQTEQLHQQITALQAEKQLLDKAYTQANKAEIKAENDVQNNLASIKKCEEQVKQLTTRRDGYMAEIEHQLGTYYPAWQTRLAATRQALIHDAQEYQKRQKQHDDEVKALEQLSNVVRSISDSQQTALSFHPDWEDTFLPMPFHCPNINAEWSKLLTESSKTDENIRLCNETIARCKAVLNDCPKSEDELDAITQRAQGLNAAKALINSTAQNRAAQQKALSDAETSISSKLSELGAEDEGAMPDKAKLTNMKQQLEESLGQTKTQLGIVSNQLKNNSDNTRLLSEREATLKAAIARFEKWNTLNGYFGDTRFRTLVQSYILRPLLQNANIYLSRITDRYELTCSNENEQLSILVRDLYQKGQLRSATILSGGEQFMISLALSLALSSLQKNDMNINILFIDEGFGTLDIPSLNAVKNTLMRLGEITNSSSRRVGIISHRTELEESIPAQIQVIKKGEGRSIVKPVRISQ